MPTREYDSFSYHGREIELSDALNKNEKDLLPHFDKDALFCPECRQARLTFTRATSFKQAYLSTRPGTADAPNNHSEWCSHWYKKATKSETVVFYRSLSDNQIQDRLEAVIHQLMRAQGGAGQDAHDVIANNPYVATSITDARTVRRLPRRSIYSIYEVGDDELKIPVLIYGTVQLGISERGDNNEARYYSLNVRARQNGNHLRYFYLQQNLEDIENAPDGQLYYIALIAVFDKDAEGRLKSRLYRGAFQYVAF